MFRSPRAEQDISSSGRGARRNAEADAGERALRREYGPQPRRGPRVTLSGECKQCGRGSADGGEDRERHQRLDERKARAATTGYGAREASLSSPVARGSHCSPSARVAVMVGQFASRENCETVSVTSSGWLTGRWLPIATVRALSGVTPPAPPCRSAKLPVGRCGGRPGST